jgi:hypothetical protein
VLGHWGVLVLMNGIHVFFAALREGSVGLSHVELAAEGTVDDVHHIGGIYWHLSFLLHSNVFLFSMQPPFSHEMH